MSKVVLLSTPTPCLSTALAFFDGYRSATLSANLIQTQRDYFGAHTHELLATPGKYIHTNGPEVEALFRLPVITLNTSIALSILSL